MNAGSICFFDERGSYACFFCRYLLTPVGARMPDLFVSREVFTKNTDATAEGIQEANSSASFAVAGGAANKKVCWQFTCEHVSKKVTSNNRPQLPCCKSAQ